MSQSYRMMIGGQSVASAKLFDVLNPADLSVVGACPQGSAADVEAAVTAAAAAFPVWAATADAERVHLCNAIADNIEAHADELARLLTAEQGKPLNGLGSRFEIGGAVAWTRATAGLGLPIETLQDDATGRIELQRKPIGVVASITPWNWPVMIACWHIIPAIRVGNTVVIKPSEFTPLSTIRLVELINDVLPPGVVNVITGYGDVGGALTAHPTVRKIVFTGSTATGQKVMAAASGKVARVTLELGGNDAGIVLPDADPQAIAEGLFWGAFINGGQTCAALKRLYVHSTLYDAVCNALVAYARTIPVGRGDDESSVLGPVQNAAQFNKLRAMVDEAVQAGARVLIGGKPMEGPGYFYPTTIVADAHEGMRLVDEEQFGPALPIIRYDDVEEVINRTNASEFGLGGSVWSNDKAIAREIANRMECGSVWINRHGAIQPNAPFGGVKSSGIGCNFGTDGLKEFTTIQTVFC